jgi:hypothetical protein
MPARGSARRGRDQPELRRRPSGSRGSWVSEGEHEKQIEKEGKVDPVEADPSPTSSVPEFGR